MRVLPRTEKFVVVGLLTLLLTCCLPIAAYAASATVVVPGVVFVEDDGTVGVTVCIGERKCEDLIPSNGKGLLKSGRIWEGCCVDVKITYDRGKHRGHVTVLK